MSEILHHYIEIITDPAHSLVEFTFVLVDVLIIDAVRRRIKRHFHKDLSDQHQRLDREHGVPFHGDLPYDGPPPLSPEEIRALRMMAQFQIEKENAETEKDLAYLFESPNPVSIKITPPSGA